MSPHLSSKTRLDSTIRMSFKSSAAYDLDKKLWGGFSAAALRELTRLHQQLSAAHDERIGAAWALARWHANRGKPSVVLNMIASMHEIAGAPIVTTTVAVLESQCLVDLDRSSEARQVLVRAMAAQRAFNPDLCLAYSNCFANSPLADNIRLEIINRVFRNAGFLAIGKARQNDPLTLDNLSVSETPPAPASGGPKVSVVVPVHNAAATIKTAIDSIVRQTWPDLDIVVVDDCSTDATWDTVCSLAQLHARIVPVRQDRNQGVYSARNRGMEIASGELITTHDADGLIRKRLKHRCGG
jgi:hypothetical protein